MTAPTDRRAAGRSATLFSAVALGLSLAYWLLFIVHERGGLAFDPASSLMGVTRGYGPTVAALVAAWAFYGQSGLARIWSRVIRWRFRPHLLALAVLGPLAVSAVVFTAVRLAGVDLQLDSGQIQPKLLLIFFVFAVVDGPVGEEIGWRGFLLPELLRRTGPIRASLAVGLVWYLWHLPLYAATGQFELTTAFLAGYVINVLSLSLIHTWFFLRSGGSALLAVLFHTATNYSIFLLATLFPAVRSIPSARAWHLVCLAILALGAALSLRQDSRPR
jgi:membrane protease YdiL (CAAX protease family)